MHFLFSSLKNVFSFLIDCPFFQTPPKLGTKKLDPYRISRKVRFSAARNFFFPIFPSFLSYFLCIDIIDCRQRNNRYRDWRQSFSDLLPSTIIDFSSVFEQRRANMALCRPINLLIMVEVLCKNVPVLIYYMNIFQI